MEDLTKEFIAESQEGLDQMERCLTTLEVRPDDPKLVAEIFRAVHSIKGTTGFLGFGRLETLAHRGESLLGLVRDGEVPVTGKLISGLLDLMDGLRRILVLIDETGGEGKRQEDDDRSLIELLGSLALPTKEVEDDREQFAYAPSHKELQSAGLLSPAEEWRKGQQSTYTGSDPGGSGERTLRVDIDVLNRMMNLVGELVLTRNQLLQSSLNSQQFSQLGRRLNSVTADLRETVMQARMQPVGHVFSKFPRLVRDLAKTCGKMVRIEFSGQETGLDKSLLETIKDPLTHAVRNCVDHGIEMPKVRIAAGKAAEGVLRLRAFQRGGAVVIELTDDGAGIPVERVRAKAVERRLVTRERAEAMTDADAVQMVFLPGFSTAEAVTNISGRGVGMDVVRANVEKVGGSVELETKAGAGTTLRLRVPLTLAIIPALVVVSGGQSFALPQSALVELVYVALDEVAGAVKKVGGVELYALRDRLLPMVRLDRLLGITADIDREQEAQAFYLAMVEVDGCRFGLVLDDLLAPEEIVVKPLSFVLREIGMFSGATILGNGTLALILDIGATASRAGIGGRAHEIAPDSSCGQNAGELTGQRFLVFEGAAAQHGQKMAIALDQVERIECMPVSSVEHAGGHALLQHHGEALPLRDDCRLLKAAGEGGAVTVLICTLAAGRRIGLVVSEVSHVASGTRLPQSEEAFGCRLVLIEGKVAMLQELGPEMQAPYEELQEVA